MIGEVELGSIPAMLEADAAALYAVLCKVLVPLKEPSLMSTLREFTVPQILFLVRYNRASFNSTFGREDVSNEMIALKVSRLYIPLSPESNSLVAIPSATNCPTHPLS